jgi:hypothetical protein
MIGLVFRSQAICRESDQKKKHVGQRRENQEQAIQKYRQETAGQFWPPQGQEELGKQRRKETREGRETEELYLYTEG